MSGIGLDRNVRFEHLEILNNWRKDLDDGTQPRTDYEPKRTRTPENTSPP
jgi:hypothetical protein